MNNIVEILKFLVGKEVSRIRISITDFTDLLRTNFQEFPWEPMTDKDILKSGFFGSYLHINIYVDKSVAPKTAELGLKDGSTWSLAIPFNDMDKFERLIALKAFW